LGALRLFGRGGRGLDEKAKFQAQGYREQVRYGGVAQAEYRKHPPSSLLIVVLIAAYMYGVTSGTG